ncbi:exodeoxyribonuclease III [Planktothrix sp. FACHB-1355]|uniref:Exodeoxyribonuclease III n=1 Tax=Aerosakkonema funiforme FACHB-1375 TaxID=2949571 RepID=A0A926ZJE3_9CYAN|nr:MULTISPECIES: exodeoxyribonuclease III [Oscillatoriales]MBD2184282.1 exodeoxyribonuclease III [Aerosakkonema funiforme FACHB-1375]MBD3558918.1 exodeoxyribonuclease III [Planktothrix sp. FACHB-1355]
MKVATWNVNSIRTRLEQVVNWLQSNPVDVLCLQETKVQDAEFPRSPWENLGYHLYIWGQKSYNGVAILSRKPLEEVSAGFAPILGISEFDEQKRVITGVVDNVRIVNLYVPNGSEVGSEKYVYKLSWLKVLREYLQALLEKQPSAMCVCGDFNIALEDKDIHNPKGREKMVMATDLERQALQTVLELGLADAFRKFTQEGGNFSWWDYRSAAFRGNRGWRIDHHYLTPELYDRAIACTIDVTPRALTQPSDHAPTIVEF